MQFTDEQRALNLRWAEALRSGEYQQEKFVLKKSDGSGYCCLGVLCEIAGVSQSFEQYPSDDDDHFVNENVMFWFDGYDFTSDDRPSRRWFTKVTGFTGAQMEAFMNMNDMQNASFGEIANLVVSLMEPKGE